MNAVFQRKIYADLLSWKSSSNGHSALLIEGARRVGKSTVVSQFAHNEYKSCIIIDFNKVSKDIMALFDNLMNLDFIFTYLQNTFNVQLFPRESVIVFDEVQKCPAARQAIKYLVEDGRFDYIETGSLISIRKNTQNITIPSEEDRINMFPMDYEEFCWALGDVSSISLIRNVFSQKISLGDDVNRRRMRDFRLYMLVGGMPQAVSEYIETKNFAKVDEVKRRIIKLYFDDFLKIDPSGRLSRLFMNIPAQLSSNSSRYRPSSVIAGISASQMESFLSILDDSRTVNVAYHACDPNVGLPQNADHGRFKLFAADTGLFVTLAYWDKDYADNVLYTKLLNDKLSANMGYVYENMVAQILRSSGNKLYYFTFPKDEKHLYEIDFLLVDGDKISPVEVKSSAYTQHASLDAFCSKYSSRIKNRYIVYAKDLRHDGQILLLPIYMLGFIN